MMPDISPSQAASLGQLQQWMQAVIMHPAGIEIGAASPPAREALPSTGSSVEEVLQRSSRLSSADRLRVYGNAYFARLLECLESEFPAMVKAIGEDAFHGLAFGYLNERPSASYTLSQLAVDLPAYLKRTRPPRESPAPDFADFLCELTTLERIYNEVFDGIGPEQLTGLKVDDLTGLSPERFAKSRLDFHDSVRLVSFSFPVHEFATAVRRGEESPSFPEARFTRLVITRRDYVVRRFEVNEAQFTLLTALHEGKTVGEALETLSSVVFTDEIDLATELHLWFQNWSVAPLFRGLA